MSKLNFIIGNTTQRKTKPSKQSAGGVAASMGERNKNCIDEAVLVVFVVGGTVVVVVIVACIALAAVVAFFCWLQKLAFFVREQQQERSKRTVKKSEIIVDCRGPVRLQVPSPGGQCLTSMQPTGRKKDRERERMRETCKKVKQRNEKL